MKAVEHELDGERGEQDAEDLLGDEHAAFVEMVTGAVGELEHADVEGEHDGEDGEDHREHGD